MKPAISIDEVVDYISSEFYGLAPQKAWGEMTFFYNPDHVLTRGTYFCTLKEKDGENDKASRLDRPDVYRLNFGLPTNAYLKRFGPKPERPEKGHAIQGPWDFTKLDQITPHPVYGWMGWVAVLNPSSETFEQCKPLLALAYDKAVKAFGKRREA